MSFIECNCNTDGSTNGNCDHIGKCTCKTGIDGFFQGFSGEKCEKCQDGFYGFPFCQGRSLFSLFVKEITCSIISCYSFIFTGCECNQQGSEGVACDKNGMCSCKSNISGNKCQKCVEGFVRFPDCQSRFILHYFSKKFSHSTINSLI